MASKWPYRRIQEVAAQVGMGPFGSSIKVETFVSDGVPVISGQHLHGFRLCEDEGFNFITLEHAERLRNANVYRGDIVFTHAGNIGNVAYIPDNSRFERYVISQRQFYMRSDRTKALPAFVTYYFKTPEGQHKLLANSSSVGVPSIAQPVTYLRQIEIPVPPLPEQRAIAHILGSLDDKIELNRKMNETLEAVARALFQSWFVDFHPVRAKAEGRQPAGMDAETAALFPDGFEESELGEIPKGWKVVPLPQAIEVNPSRLMKNGDIAPYLDMANMPTRGHRAIEWTNRPFRSGTRFINGDTLVARITPCLENGKTAFVDFLTLGQVGWGSTEFIVLRPKPPLPFEYAYLLARGEAMRSHLIQNMTGTSGRQRAPASCLDQYSMVLPSELVARRFGGIVHPLIVTIRVIDEQSRTLAALRDTLLPKLMKGEIRVKDMERLAGGP